MYVTLSFRSNPDPRYGLVKKTEKPEGYWRDCEWQSIPQHGDILRFDSMVALKDIHCYHDGFPNLPGMNQIDLSASYRVEYVRHSIGLAHEHNIVLKKL